jgi:hypothetical protein
MTDKFYTTKKTVTLADGTIREYTSQYKYNYTPVDKTNKITKGKVIEKIKEANPEQLKQIKEFLDRLFQEQEVLNQALDE